MIRNAIRRWLGLHDLDITIEGEFDAMRVRHIRQMAELEALALQIKINNVALARLVNKIDPLYAMPEDDPARRAESDRLAEETIRRLRGEVLASNRKTVA